MMHIHQTCDCISKRAQGDRARIESHHDPPMIITNKNLLKAYRTPGYCELCHFYFTIREPHHISARGMGGGKRLDIRINLIGLGGKIFLPDGRMRPTCKCHDMAQRNKIRQAQVWEIVAKREGVTVEEIGEVMAWLNRTIGRPSEGRILEFLKDLSEGAMLLAIRELTEAGILEGAKA